MTTTRKSTKTHHANISPSPQDKGVRLTIEVVAYDGGMITCDDEPMNNHGDQGQGYAATASAMMEKLWMLQAASAKRVGGNS